MYQVQLVRNSKVFSFATCSRLFRRFSTLRVHFGLPFSRSCSHQSWGSRRHGRKRKRSGRRKVWAISKSARYSRRSFRHNTIRIMHVPFEEFGCACYTASESWLKKWSWGLFGKVFEVAPCSTSMTRIPSLPQKRKGFKAIPVSIVPSPVLGTSRWLVYCSSWNTKPRGIDDSGGRRKKCQWMMVFPQLKQKPGTKPSQAADECASCSSFETAGHPKHIWVPSMSGPFLWTFHIGAATSVWTKIVDICWCFVRKNRSNHYYLKRSPAEESHQPGPAEIQHQLSGRHVYTYLMTSWSNWIRTATCTASVEEKSTAYWAATHVTSSSLFKEQIPRGYCGPWRATPKSYKNSDCKEGLLRLLITWPLQWLFSEL